MNKADLLELLAVHDLHLAPIDDLGALAELQHHPDTAATKWRLDHALVEHLDALVARDPDLDVDDTDAVAAMRAIAHLDVIPPVYQWLSEQATLDEARAFLELEGGPDGGFDDLVAACQLGIDGEPKLELARNYWDEMGNGRLERVHTELHRKLTRTLGLRTIPRDQQPVEALVRSALGSLVATNRWLQPEMVGALGLIELQAGPRSGKVVRALDRLGCSWDAIDFYAEHAEADPIHGKAWVERVVAGLQARGDWGTRMVRGARWRSAVNTRFFAAMHDRFAREDGRRGDPVAPEADARDRRRAAA